MNNLCSILPFYRSVDVNDQRDIKYWTRFFGCTAEQLRQVVAKVGNDFNRIQTEIEASTTSIGGHYGENYLDRLAAEPLPVSANLSGRLDGSRAYEVNKAKK